jgi:hypothetical protein
VNPKRVVRNVLVLLGLLLVFSIGGAMLSSLSIGRVKSSDDPLGEVMLAHISWRWGFLASAVIAGGGVSYAIESQRRAVWLSALLIAITSSFWRELSHYDDPSDRIGTLISVLLIALLAVVGYVLAELSAAQVHESAERTGR